LKESSLERESKENAIGKVRDIFFFFGKISVFSFFLFSSVFWAPNFLKHNFKDGKE